MLPLISMTIRCKRGYTVASHCGVTGHCQYWECNKVLYDLIGGYCSPIEMLEVCRLDIEDQASNS